MASMMMNGLGLDLSPSGMMDYQLSAIQMQATQAVMPYQIGAAISNASAMTATSFSSMGNTIMTLSKVFGIKPPDPETDGDFDRWLDEADKPLDMLNKLQKKLGQYQ